MLHPLYALDLSPFDYHLFLSLNNPMRSGKFDNVDHVNNEVSNCLQGKAVGFYKNGIYKLPNY